MDARFQKYVFYERQIKYEFTCGSYMPCRCTSNNKDIKNNWLKNIISALVFASSLTIISEVVLPIFGFVNMADGLQVANENKLFYLSLKVLFLLYYSI